MNKKIVSLTLLALMAFAAVVVPLDVSAESANVGVYIGQITPTSATGPVGTSVNILGSIHSANGTYKLVMGGVVVTTGTAQGYYVDTNFTVPEVAKGAYPLVLNDVAINVNYSSQFTVETGYSIAADPSFIQEGDSISFTVTVTGAQANTPYNANVAVQPPSLSTKYSKTVSIGSANDKGTATAQVTFPSGFQPDGAVTNYAGTYKIFFNESQNLATNEFTVGFTDSNTYHRGETVNIRTTGYSANAAATITIANAKTGITFDTVSATASADGVVAATWVVPQKAAIGAYTIKITADGTQKPVMDSETFTVPGYVVRVQTTNLAGAPVPALSVQALDESSNTASNATGGSDGIANLKLEKGNVYLTVYSNGLKIGEANVTVSGEATFTIHCELTNLKVTVKNTEGIVMPSVDIKISYNDGSSTGSASGLTDASGSYTLTSVLVGASFTIEASMYGQVFNAGNNSVTGLSSQATSEVLIIAPTVSLTIRVQDFNQQVITGARVELVERTNGIFASGATDSSGLVNAEVTFGMYRARVYKDSILINETYVQAFNGSQHQIRCTLYGIDVSVSVVDFFGNPVSNANVTLNGPATEKLSAITQGNGVATFNHIIGGDMQIIAQAQGSPDTYQALTLNVDQPTTVHMRLDKYVAFASILIPTASLLTIALIIIAVVLFLLVELYLRQRHRHVSKA